MRVLITGITGFAGSHLAEYILAEHPDVAIFGTYRWRSRMENLDTLMAMGVLDVIEGRYSSGAGQADQAHKGRVTLLHCELTDAGAVEKLIAATRPDRIFHLAAQSFVQSSFDEPSATMRINIEAQLNVLEAIRRHDTKIRMHIAGSSEEYWLALERGEAGEVYNVGRGRTWAIGEMLSMQLANSTVKIRSQEDPARLRPSDVPILWADASKFQKATGWEPKIPFEQTLRDLLDYWRDRVRRDTVRIGAVLNA